MQMALQDIQNSIGITKDEWKPRAAIISNLLRDRLAQPEPEPVARVDYTAPPKREWVGFTSAERDEIVPMLVQSLINHDDKTMTVLLRAILIDVEAKLKEKNT
jgi:hypothetical protein